jgi:hypothetical protein
MSESLKSINELDLEPIMVKAMDKDEGYGWSLEFTKQVSAEYKRYLILCLENPNFPMIPSKFVDDFWHLHILDTQKYQEDCSRIFGYFLHHFPYFGMRGEEDAENLKKHGWKVAPCMKSALEKLIRSFGQLADAVLSAADVA